MNIHMTCLDWNEYNRTLCQQMARHSVRWHSCIKTNTFETEGNLPLTSFSTMLFIKRMHDASIEYTMPCVDSTDWHWNIADNHVSYVSNSNMVNFLRHYFLFFSWLIQLTSLCFMFCKIFLSFLFFFPFVFFSFLFLCRLRWLDYENQLRKTNNVTNEHGPSLVLIDHFEPHSQVKNVFILLVNE
jgi:hypothetical protein